MESRAEKAKEAPKEAERKHRRRSAKIKALERGSPCDSVVRCSREEMTDTPRRWYQGRFSSSPTDPSDGSLQAAGPKTCRPGLAPRLANKPAELLPRGEATRWKASRSSLVTTTNSTPGSSRNCARIRSVAQLGLVKTS